MPDSVVERELVKRLGVSVQTSRKLRATGELKEGEHWEVVNGVGVVFSQAGVDALAALVVGKKKNGAADSVARAIATGQERVEVGVTVLRADFLNRRVILGREGERTVTVRVRDAGLYVPGMVFAAVEGEGGVFDEARAPRRRGVA